MMQRAENILFLDIETVPLVYEFDRLDSGTQSLFDAKTRFGSREFPDVNERYKKAGIYAEFGKIVCVSCGYYLFNRGKTELRIRSFAGDNEIDLLRQFCDFVTKNFDEDFHRLCAHNGKEFDFPYLCRRMIVLGIPIPRILHLQERKPWEVPHIDTMELWKFGDHKHYTSLDLLAHVLNVPSSKTDMNGSDVARVYWEEKDLQRIIEYCEQDVKTLALVWERLCGVHAGIFV
ncbi:MAG TPA: 3'-5' exonuclease [Flavobacteriales bacterium]|nr:3'-5' exonuclease [Flavobacteriales bacterium]HCA82433.1 3'-5' exonuclease [Flavobacteriales bacterium]HRE73826.1 3'-5' exonuclease [Flavobacteriales bacterium]HRE96863.1 3'-5' exonuclease [Flavobacteriales bacterium]HRJ35806.1 3'-5' exonuclease [Flavobacteriales bacterium]